MKFQAGQSVEGDVRSVVEVFLWRSTNLSCTIVNMKIIADTNIFIAVVLDQPEKRSIISMTGNADIVAPEILPYELGNAFSAMLKRRQVTKDKALAAMEAATQIPVRLVAVDVQAALILALEYNIYAYDAYFLTCASKLSLPLMTLDRRMKDVATALKIKIMEPEA